MLTKLNANAHQPRRRAAEPELHDPPAGLPMPSFRSTRSPSPNDDLGQLEVPGGCVLRPVLPLVGRSALRGLQLCRGLSVSPHSAQKTSRGGVFASCDQAPSASCSIRSDVTGIG